MAKGSKKAQQQEEEEEEEEEEDEEEYEVEAIQKHRRDKKSGKLQYFVSWVGYPSDEPDNDTWINEEDAEGAPELVDAYWKSLPAPKRAERTAAPSAKAKSKLAPAKKADAPRSASATLKRGASKLDDSPTEGGRASRGTSGAEKEVVLNGSAVKGNAAKRVKRGEDSPELGTPVKEKAKKAAPVGGKNDGKKAEVKKVEVQKVEQEDEEDEEMDDDEGGDVDGHKHVRHELTNYADILDWEPLVKEIDTIEQRQDRQGLQLFVVWKEDNSYSWVPSDVARIRCPQKVIDFYEGHLKFKVNSD